MITESATGIRVFVFDRHIADIYVIELTRT